MRKTERLVEVRIEGKSFKRYKDAVRWLHSYGYAFYNPLVTDISFPYKTFFYKELYHLVKAGFEIVIIVYCEWNSPIGLQRVLMERKPIIKIGKTQFQNVIFEDKVLINL